MNALAGYGSSSDSDADAPAAAPPAPAAASTPTARHDEGLLGESESEEDEVAAPAALLRHRPLPLRRMRRGRLGGRQRRDAERAQCARPVAARGAGPAAGTQPAGPQRRPAPAPAAGPARSLGDHGDPARLGDDRRSFVPCGVNVLCFGRSLLLQIHGEDEYALRGTIFRRSRRAIRCGAMTVPHAGGGGHRPIADRVACSAATTFG